MEARESGSGATGGGGQHGQEGPTVSRPTYRLLQILRAVAALMVVVHHATIMLVQRDHLWRKMWINGESGVDLFFVISGFVMTVSSAPLRHAPHPARTFLARRLERVVPMYWIVTTAKVAVLLLVPTLGLNALGSLSHVVCSYLFVPSFNPEGALEPVVVVGWTLNFEVAFYLLFAVALLFRVRPVLLLTPVLVGIAAWDLLHLVPGPLWLRLYENSLTLEFLYGVLAAVALPWLLRLPWGVGLGLVVLGFAPLLAWMAPGFSPWRGVLWGVPAAAVVAGALVLERRWGARRPRWLLELGDASYSIYLVHTFALPLTGLVIGLRVQQSTPYFAMVLTLAVVFSTLAGVLSYRLVERPITDWLKGRRQTAIPAVA